MAVVGAIASVVQIADVSLRLSIKLFSFGQIVASADTTVLAIGQEVSLTHAVLHELKQALDEDKEARLLQATALHLANQIVKECGNVFNAIDDLFKQASHLQRGLEDQGAKRKKEKAAILLERIMWPYLQPKLDLLRSNLERHTSKLVLLMSVLNFGKLRRISERYLFAYHTLIRRLLTLRW